MTLATRLQQPKALLAPGVYDAFTALVAEQAGFEALYLSGASIAYTRLGRSDVGLTTASEVAETLARTDAVAVEGLEAALERAEHYLACGVDALFIEALRSPEQMKAACDRFGHRIPLLANMVEGGKTPVHSAAVLGELGFRIVIFPGGTARAVGHLLRRYYASLHQHQTTAPFKDEMLDFDQLNALIGTPELLALGKRYDGPQT
jgi:2-methylisocitrate lyase-like PEP mutase family enzyme